MASACSHFKGIGLLLALALAGCASTRDAERKRGCQTFLIVPPQSASQAASDQVAAAWIEEVLPHLDKCDKVIKEDAAKDVFHFVNVSNTKPLSQKDPKGGQLNTLREKTAATHVVFISYKVARRVLTMRATVYQLRPKWVLAGKKQLDDEVLAKYQKQLQKNSPLVAGEDVKSLFAGFVPNAVTFGAGTSVLQNDRVESKEVDELEAHRRNALPYVVQGIGIANVQHRYGYRLFDVDWGFSGSLRLLADSPQLVYQYHDPARRGSPDETYSYNYAFYSVAALATIDGFLYTPLGTTFLGIGFGVAPYRFQDADGLSITSAQVLGRYHLGHRVFLSDRWYFEFSVDQITFVNGIIDGPLFKAYNMQSSWFGVGWFFPRRGWLE